MVFSNGFPMLGGLFSGLRQTSQQPAMYGNQFGMPPQGGMGMGYMPPYLMQYMQQFGMPMQQMRPQTAEQYMRQFGALGQSPNVNVQQPNMPMQQSNMSPQQMQQMQQQGAEQYMQRFGLGQLGQPAVPGNAANAVSIQNRLSSLPPELLAQINAASGAPAQANMVQGRRATILPPKLPTPAASSPSMANVAAPRASARASGTRGMDGRALASVLSANRALLMR